MMLFLVVLPFVALVFGIGAFSYHNIPFGIASLLATGMFVYTLIKNWPKSGS